MKADELQLPHKLSIPNLPGVPNGEGREGHAVNPIGQLLAAWPFSADFTTRSKNSVTREFGRITLPVFILHGTADKATMPAGSRHFHDNAGSSDKTLKLYEGHFHDLLNDFGKEQVDLVDGV